jgi:hypothetical protein
MSESVGGADRIRSAGRVLVLVVLAGVVALSLTGCGTFGGSDASDGTGVPGDIAIEPMYDMSEEARTAESGIAPDIGIPVPPPADGAGPDASTVPPDERYIIRTLGVRLQVEEVEPAVERVRDAVDAAGGTITAVQVSSDDSPIYRYEAGGSFADGAPLKGYITARIPPQELDGFVEAVADLGTVLRQAEDETDATQEHIDISARLDNLRAQEVRLRELFDRGEEIEDLLAVEREIARVRGEIESFEARLAFIERQAAMATVTIELVGRQPVVAPAGEDWGFVSAIRTGIRGLVYTINGLIVFTLSTLPLIVIALVAWLVIRAILRSRRARRERAAVNPPTDHGTGG